MDFRESNQQLGHTAHYVLPGRSPKWSVEGLFRGRTRRLPEVSRTLERFSQPAPPNLVVLRLRPSLHARWRRAAR